MERPRPRDVDGPGPVEQRLAEFGQTRALVFGPRGECSKDVLWLINYMAQTGGERRWRDMRARSISEAVACLKTRILRSVGITAVLAAARLKRERFGILLSGGKAAMKRRKQARGRARSDRDEYDFQFGFAPHSG